MGYKQERPLPVIEGGTGDTTLTQHGILLGNGTSAVNVLGVGASNTVIQGNTGADPSFTGSPSVSGSVTAGTGVNVTTGDVVITSGNLTLPNTTTTTGEILMGGSRFLHGYGSTAAGGRNTFTGIDSGNLTLTIATALRNSGYGNQALHGLTSGQDNSQFGMNGMFSTTTGSGNCGLGAGVLQNLTIGNNNVGIGRIFGNGGALDRLVSGSNNVAIGPSSSAAGAAGHNYTGAESNNILISNPGVTGESNVMRLGETGTGTSQVSTTYIAGNVLKQAQPAFFVYPSVDVNNQTGNGATVTVTFNTEIYDQGSNFSANTFTAPVTGRYFFTAQVRLNQLDATATDGFLTLNASNRDVFSGFNIGAIANASTAATMTINSYMDMDALDTCFLQVTVSGMAGNTVDIIGGSALQTCFSGSLVC